jgi:predicted nucleic acid-binding protein
MRTLYLETSVVSYLAARPTRDLVVAGHQQLTREWWERRRALFEIYVSQLVLQEAGAGDQEAAGRRLELLKGTPLVATTDEAVLLGRRLVESVPLPRKAAADALHIALAAVHGIEYLLTWNMTHIANAELRAEIERVCRSSGFEPPVLCTPEELMGSE